LFRKLGWRSWHARKRTSRCKEEKRESPVAELKQERKKKAGRGGKLISSFMSPGLEEREARLKIRRGGVPRPVNVAARKKEKL